MGHFESFPSLRKHRARREGLSFSFLLLCWLTEYSEHIANGNGEERDTDGPYDDKELFYLLFGALPGLRLLGVLEPDETCANDAHTQKHEREAGAAEDTKERTHVFPLSCGRADCLGGV